MRQCCTDKPSSDRALGVDMRKTGRTIRDVEISDLTTRQTQVIELLALGHSNAKIASDLDIAERTVNRHINETLKKATPPVWSNPRVFLANWYNKESGRLREKG